MKKLSFFVVLSIFVSCSKKDNIADNKLVNTTIIKYARNFDIHDRGEQIELFLFNPKNRNDTISKILLTKNEINYNTKHQYYDAVLKIPVSTIVITSSTYIGMLSELELHDKIIGLNIEPENIFDDKIRNKVLNNKIKIIGSFNKVNDELLIDLNPDLIVLPFYFDNKLNNSQSNFVHNLDWLESSPLARAEWLKFIAVFFDKYQLADSIFKKIEENYINIKNKAINIKSKPTILAGSYYNGIWYTPGGKSYMADFFRDANGSYIWSENTDDGSIPLSIEVIFDKQIHADIWIVPSHVKTKNELQNQHKLYRKFKPFKENKIYSYNKMTNKFGTNAWWEKSIIHPDFILKDLIKVMHPELYPKYETQYLKHLK